MVSLDFRTYSSELGKYRHSLVLLALGSKMNYMSYLYDHIYLSGIDEDPHSSRLFHNVSFLDED